MTDRPSVRTRFERRRAARWHARTVLNVLLVVLGLAIAWILVSFDIERGRTSNGLHARYRDPVTGRDVVPTCRSSP